MRNWFRAQRAGIDNTDKAEAYREGGVDERRRVDGEPETAARNNRAQIDLAYERGRARGRGARRGSPLMSLLVVVLVAAGAALIYLAVRNGSFSNGGAVVDQSLNTVAHAVNAPLKGAAKTTGEALQNAGNSLK